MNLAMIVHVNHGPTATAEGHASVARLRLFSYVRLRRVAGCAARTAKPQRRIRLGGQWLGILGWQGLWGEYLEIFSSHAVLGSGFCNPGFRVFRSYRASLRFRI